MKQKSSTAIHGSCQLETRHDVWKDQSEGLKSPTRDEIECGVGGNFACRVSSSLRCSQAQSFHPSIKYPSQPKGRPDPVVKKLINFRPGSLHGQQLAASIDIASLILALGSRGDGGEQPAATLIQFRPCSSQNGLPCPLCHNHLL